MRTAKECRLTSCLSRCCWSNVTDDGRWISGNSRTGLEPHLAGLDDELETSVDRLGSLGGLGLLDGSHFLCFYKLRDEEEGTVDGR